MFLKQVDSISHINLFLTELRSAHTHTHTHTLLYRSGKKKPAYELHLAKPVLACAAEKERERNGVKDTHRERER